MSHITTTCTNKMIEKEILLKKGVKYKYYRWANINLSSFFLSKTLHFLKRILLVRF